MENVLLSCGKPRVEHIHRRDVNNLLWQFIQGRKYVDAESNLATSGGRPLLLNLENYNASGGENDCVS